MQDNMYEITLALAAMIQSASAASDFAQSGKMDEKIFQTSLHSIFQTEPKSISDIYDGIENLKLGLEKLQELFSSKDNRMQMKYLVSIIQLQKKIMTNRKSRDYLEKRIEQIKKQVNFFSLTHPTVISNLADAYLETVNPFRFRIMIWGHKKVVNIQENMEKIRVLLLAGIRAAVLWRQVGGSRWQLLFSRSKIREVAKNCAINP
jgi:high frequency lysogenization protein